MRTSNHTSRFGSHLPGIFTGFAFVLAAMPYWLMRDPNTLHIFMLVRGGYTTLCFLGWISIAHFYPDARWNRIMSYLFWCLLVVRVGSYFVGVHYSAWWRTALSDLQFLLLFLWAWPPPKAEEGRTGAHVAAASTPSG